MGIQDLLKYVKDTFPEQLMEFTLAQWRGHSFAIDISIFLNKFVKSAGDSLWMNSFFLMLCTLKKHGIKAVCVFDGPNPPVEKKAEQAKRKETSAKATIRLENAKRMRDLMQNTYTVSQEEIPAEIQEECKQIVGKRRKIPYAIDWSDAVDVYNILTEVIYGVEKQIAPITDTQRERAWKIVQMMGLPAFQADGEAEALCAYMAIHGYVDAVLTEDSDVLAYGTPWMLAFRDYKLSDEKIRGIYLPNLLDAFDYTMEEFRDLCILLSCDYNERVKGYLPGKKQKKAVSIGCVGAIMMIDEYRRLEEVEPFIEDIEPLIYERCRELFTPITDEQLKEIVNVIPYSVRPDFSTIATFIRQHKLTVTVDYIQSCWTPPTVVFESDSDDNFDTQCDDKENDILCAPIVCNSEQDGKIYIRICVKSEQFYVSLATKWIGANVYDMLLPYKSAIDMWIHENLSSPAKNAEYITQKVCEIPPTLVLETKPANVKILDLS